MARTSVKFSKEFVLDEPDWPEGFVLDKPESVPVDMPKPQFPKGTPRDIRPIEPQPEFMQRISRPQFRTTPRDIRPPETGLWPAVSAIAQSIKEMVAPTTEYMRRESEQASHELSDRLSWWKTYLFSLGGRVGPKGLREELAKEAESFAGFGPALMPVAGETGSLAIEWGWLYPKLFKLAGVSGQTIAKIPKVARGMKALKAMGGIQKLATKHPHLYSTGTKALAAFASGEAAGQTLAAIESFGKEKTVEQWVVDMNKRGALMGGVATAFSLTHSYDQYKYITQVRRHLRFLAYNRYVGRVNKGMVPRHSARLGETEARKIDDIIYALEQQMLGAPQELYGGKKPELTPQQAAELFAKHGYVPGSVTKSARQLAQIRRPGRRPDIFEEVKALKAAGKGRVISSPVNSYREVYNPQTGQRYVIPEGTKVILPKGYEISDPINLKPAPFANIKLAPVRTPEEMDSFREQLVRELKQLEIDQAQEREIARMDAELAEIQRPARQAPEAPPEPSEEIPPPPTEEVAKPPRAEAVPTEPPTGEAKEKITPAEPEVAEKPAEVEPEAEFSTRRRNRILKETEKRIAESDIYQVEMEGIEKAPIEVGFYYVPAKFRAEVEDIIGKGRKTRLQRMFTFNPSEKKIIKTPEGKAEIGPTNWASAVQEALGRGKEGVDETWGEMDIADFVQQVKDSVEAEEGGLLSTKAVEAAEASGDPHIQYIITKRQMLRDGYSPEEIDDMTREWAEQYGLDEAEIENEFIGAEPLKIKEIKALPEDKRDAAIEALARENVLSQERQEAKNAVNEVLKANDLEAEVEEVTEIPEKPKDEIPFERRGKPTGAAIITPAGREIVQLAYGADSATGYHEAYHTLRRHLTKKDTNVLEHHFKGDQEAEARAFAEFARTGKVKQGYLRAIWRKLIEKLRKVKSALQGKGYRTANDIFGEIQRGVVPKEGAAPGVTQFERGVFGQPIQEQLRLPFKERLAAIKKVALQEAREKIAKRKAKPTKKLWKMTKAEFDAIAQSVSQKWDAGFKVKSTSKIINTGGIHALPKGYKESSLIPGFINIETGKFFTRQEHKDLVSSAEYQLDQMWRAKKRRGAPWDVHEKEVRDAIDEGKSVPREVLEEYKGERWAQEALRKPYEEWRPKGRVPIKTKLIKAVDAEIARTMKPKSNSVNITPEQIATKLGGLFGGAELFYDPGNPLPEVTEAFTQLVKGGPLIQFETTGDRWRREAERNARVKAEKARLKAKITPKARRTRLKIKIRDVTPTLREDFKPEVTLDELVAEPRDIKPKQKIYLTDKWFQENIRPHRKKAAMKPTSMASRSLKLLDKVLGSSSTRLYNIHPELFRQTRRYAFDVMTRSTDMVDEVEPFLKAMKKMSKDDYKMFDLALKNGYERKITELVGKYGLEKEYSIVRDVLDDLYNAAKEVGIDMEYRKEYWHRHLKDPEGFLEYFQKGDDWSIIEEAIKRRAERAGRTIEELTDAEKAQVVNTLLRGYRIEALTLARPGAAKARTVEVIDADLNQFYDDSASAMVKYIRLMNRKIAEREFFGRETKEITDLRKLQSARLTRLLKLQRRRGLKEGTAEGKYKEHISKTAEAWKAGQERLQRLTNASPENTIGGYVMDLQRTGQIKPTQEKELRDILQGIFYPRGMGRGMGLFATGVYIDTLNSPLQALTQLDEFAYSFYRSPTKSVPVAIRTALRRSKITPRDIGITSIGVEFQGPSMQRALSIMLKSTGFEQIDRLNKENYINTALAKMQAQAKGKPSPALIKRLVRVFGKDYKNVLEDLRKPIRSIEDVSDDVKYLLFNQILDIQPVAITEMPEAYNKAGNMRILYALKTFYMKRLDFIRTECWQDMKHLKSFHRGFGKLVWLAFGFALLGAGSDALKDFIKGRKFNLEDSVIDNMLKMAFFSKYQAWRTREKGAGTAFLEVWRPPTKAIDAATKDIIAEAEGKDRGWEIWRSIPLVGELYYWWFGRGREKIEAKKGKGWSEATE